MTYSWYLQMSLTHMTHLCVTCHIFCAYARQRREPQYLSILNTYIYMDTLSCHKYLQMLLMTGYHSKTSPEIFANDIRKLVQICNKNDAPNTVEYTSKQDFNISRYYDMINLRNAIYCDFVSAYFQSS
jgi:hypothetical protein